MKKAVLTLGSILVSSSFVVAGGDFKDVEPAVVPVVPMVEEDKSGFYAGLALAYNQTYSIDNGLFDDSVRTQDQTGKIVGNFGYDFSEYLAVEGRIGGSVFEEDYADVMTYSIFLKPQYPLGENFKIYGLLGFGLAQVDGTDGDEPAHPTEVGQEIMDETSFQWGLGLSYSVNEDFSVFVDYTKLADDADVSTYTYGYEFPTVYDELSTQDLTVGIIYNF